MVFLFDFMHNNDYESITTITSNDIIESSDHLIVNHDSRGFLMKCIKNHLYLNLIDANNNNHSNNSPSSSSSSSSSSSNYFSSPSPIVDYGNDLTPLSRSSGGGGVECCFDIMDYLETPVYATKNENVRCLVANCENLVKCIEQLNMCSYDYLTAAEEEYECNGKLSHSSIYSTLVAYLDASYVFSMSNFDKKKLFYENPFESVYAVNELNAEIYELFNNDALYAPSKQQPQQNKSKWDVCSTTVEESTSEQNEAQTQVASIVEEINERIVNSKLYDCNIEYFVNSLRRESVSFDTPTTTLISPTTPKPPATRNWTVAPKLINNTNIISNASNKKLSKSNCSNNTTNSVANSTTTGSTTIDPIGTKPRSMSTISKRLHRLNSTGSSRTNGCSYAGNATREELYPSVFDNENVWSNDSSTTTISQHTMTRKYELKSKLSCSLLNELYTPAVNNNSNSNNTKPQVVEQPQQQLHRVRSCYDYRQQQQQQQYNNNNRQKYKLDNTKQQHYHSVSESSSSYSSPLPTSISSNSLYNNTSSKYKYKRK